MSAPHRHARSQPAVRRPDYQTWLNEYVHTLVDTWPPLTGEQFDHLSALFDTVPHSRDQVTETHFTFARTNATPVNRVEVAVPFPERE